MAVVIPTELQPHPDQIPVWATDLDRFKLCFALGRQICQRDDPNFVRELYYGDLPTDEPDVSAA